MDKKTILVVDDDPGALECIHEALSRQGHESIPCSNASAALSLLSSGAALDLAIIDLIMPDMNGLELHGRIKQRWPELPCIMVTGSSSVESYLSAVSSGVSEYLSKPYQSSELKKVVDAVFERSAMTGGGRSRALSHAVKNDQKDRREL